jgi:hypothetical protein
VACDHVGPKELIEMAEHDLAERGVDPSAREGARFRWTENTEGGFWTSVILEVEHRGGEWVVTRIDRSADRQPDSETGFRRL